MSLIDI